MTTSTGPFLARPMVIQRSSVSLCSPSGLVMAKGSSSTVAAVSNDWPCLRRFAAAFFFAGSSAHAAVSHSGSLHGWPGSSRTVHLVSSCRPALKVVLPVARFYGRSIDQVPTRVFPFAVFGEPAVFAVWALLRATRLPLRPFVSATKAFQCFRRSSKSSPALCPFTGSSAMVPASIRWPRR